jgi:tryptophan synthase alpha chain
MTRLSAAFAKDHPALVTFVTAGDPTPDATGAILDALVAGGADVIELGMPFTDPMADGPAIQAANIRSLAAGTRTADILSIAAAFHAAFSVAAIASAVPGGTVPGGGTRNTCAVLPMVR